MIDLMREGEIAGLLCRISFTTAAFENLPHAKNAVKERTEFYI